MSGGVLVRFVALALTGLFAGCGERELERGLGFKDGDRIVFIGDSLTHSGAYPRLLETYCHRTYPERRLFFRNAGVRGDRVGDVLARYDADIASFDADHAFVLMGMNDGGMRGFDEKLFGRFTAGMGALLDRLEGQGVEVILVSPTLFDVAQSRRATAEAGDEWDAKADDYDRVLRRYGEWLREKSRERGYRYVDVHGPLAETTVLGREGDELFSLTEDGVHLTLAGDEILVRSLLERLEEADVVEEGIWEGDVAEMNAARYEEAVRPARAGWYEVKAKRYEFEGDEGAFEEWFARNVTGLRATERYAEELEAEIYETLRREKAGLELPEGDESGSN
ncbi:MAG: SGNH/GDSL hydrolase family protein [Verrucomicrobiota bacterium]